MKASSYLAGFLNHSLRMIFDDVKFIMASSSTEIYEQTISIGKGDVMIAISFPRYSKKVVNTVAFAKNSGAGVIALTDSEASPIAAHADQTLYARSDMASFADSLVAPLSVINALVVGISLHRRDELATPFKRLEGIWNAHSVYINKEHE